ncbi:DUF896 domain-containing protein [Lentilactobacillus sp. SPB1-3]|uniref:DUF896 domain-containing protein n=1 Tax=Lentilactobacillus terminaliae TaxID=3003483 RepID=A0ACD5DGY2_9LACO|nr:DUF896 domain-containing protein [Lentilactobacillus sp. SPB1-3]MCZ0977326.1 DUF896 domain-containing protein [Lentilactobacillus sp. SPB1-3]
MGDEVLKKIVPRINELAKKAKEEGLTEIEKLEQADLRKKYVARFKENFRSQIEMMKVFDDNGKEVTPDKVKKIQRKKGLRDD